MSGLPRLIAAFGGVFFSFGLLGLLLAFFQPLMNLAWVWGNLALGLFLLVGSASWSFDALRERLQSSGGRRTGVYGSSALASAALGLAILGMLAFLSTRYTKRFDWTEQQVNTLSGQTLDLLAGLDRDVELTAFFREMDSPVVRDLLDRYDHASTRLSVQFVDPNRRPDLVEAHAIDVNDLARGLLLLASGEDSVTVREFGEPEITNALLKLTRRGDRKVYFLEGHNERRAFASDTQGEGSADSRSGLGRAASALRNETFQVEPLLLATAEAVPEDADAIVIAGPTRPFFDRERELLEAYLARGGGLLVMIDPRAQTNVYEDLLRWGIALGEDVIVDRAQSLFGQATSPLASQYAEGHPIAESLGRTIFHMARSVTVAPEVGADASAGPENSDAPPELIELVFTGAASWAERDLDGWMKDGRATLGDEDLAGPVPLAVAGRPRVEAEEGAEPRIVVIGDSNFASNEFIDAFRNRDLLLNSVSWLMGDVESIAVRPNVSRSSSVSLSGQDFQRLQYLSLFVLPEGIALVGVLAWWGRRRRR